MSTRLPRSLLTLALAAVVGGCGGLTNGPFVHDGALEGTLSGKVDPGKAWVVARPAGGGQALQATVDASGHFEIEGLPPGAVDVLASTGMGQAVHQSVTIFGDRQNAFTFSLVPGATLDGIVTLDGADDGADTVVGIQGLPVSTTAGTDDRFELAGLPSGCYQVFARHPNHHQSTTGVCLDAGTTTATALHLLSSGTTSAIPFCQTCTSDTQCGTGGRCMVHLVGDISEQVCTRECASDADCPGGYSCSDVSDLALRICLPEAGSCAAITHFQDGSSCQTDADCGLPGVTEDGLCVNHVCTVPCTDDSQCPSGSACSGMSDTGVDVCQ
jgi:hypothetical protein